LLFLNFVGERNGIPIGPQAGVKWLYIYPEGISRLLNYTKDLYGNPTIYITENGMVEMNDHTFKFLSTSLTLSIYVLNVLFY
jgi:hypothetical protein